MSLLLLLALAWPVRAASTTTADGALDVPVPAGWQAVSVPRPEVLRLEGPGQFLNVRRAEANRGLVQRRVTEVADKVAASKRCPASAIQSNTMPNGVELLYRVVTCQGKFPYWDVGGFSKDGYVYLAVWHVEVADPFKYGVGVLALVKKADPGPVNGWVKSLEGDVMLPIPTTDWQDYTETARSQDPATLMHLTAGTNDILVKREPLFDEAGLAALAAGEAEERTAALGRCRRLGGGQLKLPNGWSLPGLAVECDGPAGRQVYSFAAFESGGAGYGVFGVYDRKSLEASLGAAVPHGSEKLEEKAVPIADLRTQAPPYKLWAALAAVPFFLCLLFLFRRKAPSQSDVSGS